MLLFVHVASRFVLEIKLDTWEQCRKPLDCDVAFVPYCFLRHYKSQQGLLRDPGPHPADLELRATADGYALALAEAPTQADTFYQVARRCFPDLDPNDLNQVETQDGCFLCTTRLGDVALYDPNTDSVRGLPPLPTSVKSRRSCACIPVRLDGRLFCLVCTARRRYAFLYEYSGVWTLCLTIESPYGFLWGFSK